MRGPLDIEVDLEIRAGSDLISVRGQGRGVVINAPNLAFLKQLPSHTSRLGALRNLAAGLQLADQAVVLRAAGRPVVNVDPAHGGRWLGWLLRVPGLKIHWWNWLRSRR